MQLVWQNLQHKGVLIPKVKRGSCGNERGGVSGSDGKESACNEEDQGLIPGSGRSLLQGIFLTQGLKPGLLHFRQVLYRLKQFLKGFHNALWKKSYDQPRQNTKKQRHYFANNVPNGLLFISASLGL